MNVRRVAAMMASRSGFLGVYHHLRNPATRSRVAVLEYHRVAPKRDPWSLEPMSPEIFKSQMEHLCRHYEVVSLEQLAHFVARKKTLPKKAIVLTFDDGYKDNYTYVYPILRQYNLPATIFLTAGAIGAGELFWFDKGRYAIYQTSLRNLSLEGLGSYPLESDTQKHSACVEILERLKQLPEESKNMALEKLCGLPGVDIGPDLGKETVLSWEEVREMSTHGISFGAHSVTHPILTNLSLEQAWQEISQSKELIQDKLGKEVTAFCYPNGAFNPEIVGLVRRAGFACAVGTSSHMVSCQDDPYTLGRISGNIDLHILKAMYSGLWQDVKSVFSYRKQNAAARLGETSQGIVRG